MNYTFRFTYLNCQSCTAKIHCDDCAAELKERLLQKRHIQEVAIDIPNRALSLRAAGLDEDDVLDLLEDAGIFAD